MKKNTLNLVFFVIGAVTIASFCFPTPGKTDVGISVGINIPLPALVFHEPPPVVPIPGSYVYYVPEIDVDILFHRGYWYRPHQGHWYRANSYNRRWVYVPTARVPRAVIALPHDYRRHAPVHRKVSHGEVKRKWRQWEKEKYWDREERRRGGRGEERQEGRGRGGR